MVINFTDDDDDDDEKQSSVEKAEEFPEHNEGAATATAY